MITKKLYVIPFALFLSLSMLFAGCDLGADGDTGTLEVLLHDAPANYDAVNVFIESVEVNNANTDTGWVEINSPQQSYDLLELTNGAMEVLGSAELETGIYNQIRLILSSDGHSVVIDGTEHDMFIPSGAQTGIKLNVNAEIESDITYRLLLDFDAARSVVVQGTEQSGEEYLLKPVIRATNEAITGNISGTVDPVEAEAYVYAIADSDTLSSTQASDVDGAFKLIGLEAGTYTVSVDPTDESYQSENVSDVEVTVGDTNEIGTVSLSQN